MLVCDLSNQGRIFNEPLAASRYNVKYKLISINLNLCFCTNFPAAHMGVDIIGNASRRLSLFSHQNGANNLSKSVIVKGLNETGFCTHQSRSTERRRNL